MIAEDLPQRYLMGTRSSRTHTPSKPYVPLDKNGGRHPRGTKGRSAAQWYTNDGIAAVLRNAKSGATPTLFGNPVTGYFACAQDSSALPAGVIDSVKATNLVPRVCTEVRQPSVTRVICSSPTL